MATGNEPFYSTDNGTTWNSSNFQKFNTNYSTQIHNISFFNNKFWAVGFEWTFPGYLSSTTPVIYNSNDGITWNKVFNPSSDKNMFTDIAYGNGKYVAISTNSDSKIYSSGDGVNWNLANYNTLSNTILTKLAFINNEFVILGYTDQFKPNSSSIQLTSPDGLNWVDSTLSSSTFGILTDLLIAFNKFFAIGIGSSKIFSFDQSL